MNIKIDDTDIEVDEKEWSENFPGFCYKDVDGNPYFYLAWNNDRGFLFPDVDLPANGPVVWSSVSHDWVAVS